MSPLPVKSSSQFEHHAFSAIADLLDSQRRGGQHGFNNDTTPRYDEAAAKLAWSVITHPYSGGSNWGGASEFSVPLATDSNL